MEPQIQYCRSADGTRLAYVALGSGPTLLRVSAWFLNLEDSFRYAPMSAYLTGYLPYRRLVTFDRRGVGASQREITDLSLDAHVQDALAVANQSGSESFDLLGEVDGAYVALALAARYPERVNRVVAYGPAQAPRSYYSRSAKSIRDDWSAGRRLLAADMYPDGPVESQRWARESLKDGVEQTVAARYMDAIAGFDVGALAPQVRAPTFVFGRRGRTPGYGDPRDLAAAIPNAGYAALGQESDIRPFLRAMSQFLMGDDAPREASGATGIVRPRAHGTTTVLFTDLVGHTAMMQRLGDARGRDVLREHERITRDTLKMHGGHEIKTDGDSFMVSFGSVTSAVDCAIALQRAFAARNEGAAEALHVRIGLNAGEPIEEDGDLFGAAVILASRIAAKAGAGEILVPDTVRGLLSGKGFVFSDRGEFIPKGFDEGVRLWDVRWQE
jgi:class 3 adenylate cyclase